MKQSNVGNDVVFVCMNSARHQQIISNVFVYPEICFLLKSICFGMFFFVKENFETK
jgi:hypothetical protein